jgi:hypothetical protein
VDDDVRAERAVGAECAYQGRCQACGEGMVQVECRSGNRGGQYSCYYLMAMLRMSFQT